MGWYLLSRAPELEERLHDELGKVLAGRLPTLDDVPELLYTRAIFEETVRLYPPSRSWHGRRFAMRRSAAGPCRPDPS